MLPLLIPDGSSAITGACNGLIDKLFLECYEEDTTTNKVKYVDEIKRRTGKLMVSLYAEIKNEKSCPMVLRLLVKNWVEGVIDTEYEIRKYVIDINLPYVHRRLGQIVWDASDYTGYCHRQKEIDKCKRRK